MRSVVSISDDGRWMAWSTSVSGSDWRTWYVRDVETGEDLDDSIEWSKFSGAAWDRVLDNVGIGLVYLEGANNTISSTRIAEIYYRLVANPYLALTGDIQYNRDDYVSAPTAEGMVFSLRATVNF